MPNIKPISDLRNYTEVLQDVAVGAPLFPDDGRAAMAALHIEHVGVEGFRLRQHGHVDRMGGLLPRAQGAAAVQQGASAVEGAPEGALALHLAAG